jgi:hypothetical protein
MVRPEKFFSISADGIYMHRQDLGCLAYVTFCMAAFIRVQTHSLLARELDLIFFVMFPQVSPNRL